jgi:hypothetical protein
MVKNSFSFRNGNQMLAVDRVGVYDRVLESIEFDFSRV